MKVLKGFKVGDRIRAKRDMECGLDLHGVRRVPSGATGVVVEVDIGGDEWPQGNPSDPLIWVRMDKGSDRLIHWSDDEIEHDIEKIDGGAK